MALFTVDEAVAELAGLLPVLDEIVVLRAEAAELAAATTAGGRPTDLGGLPELKAAQARLDELLTQVQQTGAELKGLAPLLVDFPSGARRRRRPAVLARGRPGAPLVPPEGPRVRRPAPHLVAGGLSTRIRCRARVSGLCG